MYMNSLMLLIFNNYDLYVLISVYKHTYTHSCRYVCMCVFYTTFTDDQLIIQKYNMKMSIQKTKTKVFRETELDRLKIIIDNKATVQVSHFNYLGSKISLGSNRDIAFKINKFQLIFSTVSRTFNNKVSKDSMIKFYKTMATLLLLKARHGNIKESNEFL